MKTSDVFTQINEAFTLVLYDQKKKWTMVHEFPSEDLTKRTTKMTCFDKNNQPEIIKKTSLESLWWTSRDMQRFSVVHVKDTDNLDKYIPVFEKAKYMADDKIVFVINTMKYVEKDTDFRIKREGALIKKIIEMAECVHPYVLLYDTKERNFFQDTLKFMQIMEHEKIRSEKKTL